MMGKFKYLREPELMLILPAPVIDAKELIYYARYVEFAAKAGKVSPGFVEIVYLDDVQNIRLPLRESVVAMQVMRDTHATCRPRGAILICSTEQAYNTGLHYRQVLSVLQYPVELVRSTSELPVYLRKWTTESTDTRALTGLLTHERKELQWSELPEFPDVVQLVDFASRELGCR